MRITDDTLRRDLRTLKRVIQQNTQLPAPFKECCSTTRGLVETLLKANVEKWIWAYDQTGREQRYLDMVRLPRRRKELHGNRHPETPSAQAGRNATKGVDAPRRKAT